MYQSEWSGKALILTKIFCQSHEDLRSYSTTTYSGHKRGFPCNLYKYFILFGALENHRLLLIRSMFLRKTRTTVIKAMTATGDFDTSRDCKKRIYSMACGSFAHIIIYFYANRIIAQHAYNRLRNDSKNSHLSIYISLHHDHACFTLRANQSNCPFSETDDNIFSGDKIKKLVMASVNIVSVNSIFNYST